MVLISDGNSEHVVHTYRKGIWEREKKIRFVNAFDLIKLLIFSLLLAPISELPFNICMMDTLENRLSGR